MASFSTKLKRIEPAYFAGDMHDVVSGKSKTFAVYVDYEHHNMEYVINKVEPVNRQNRHAVALRDQRQTKRFNEGGLAHAGNTADANAKRLAGVRQQLGEQLVALRTVIGARGLQQGDALGHGAALHHGVLPQDARQPVVAALHHGPFSLFAQAWAARICSNTSLALAGMGVPGP